MYIMSRTCKRVVYKKVKRSCKNALVGGSSGNVLRAEDAVKEFTVAIATLIPADKSQIKIGKTEYYEPITITNIEFPKNILLYAFIILYCVVVHNFKITPSKENKALIDTHILALLRDALIEKLKIRNNTEIINWDLQEQYIETNRFTYIEEHYYNIFNTIIDNKLSSDNLIHNFEHNYTETFLVIYAKDENENNKNTEINLSSYESNTKQSGILTHTYVTYVNSRQPTEHANVLIQILRYLALHCTISKIEIIIPPVLAMPKL